MKPKNSRLLVPAALALLVGLASSNRALAQTAPTPTSAPATAAATDATPIELSPFTVTSAKDNGYLAAGTLAGSRLNTSLLDTPASISVMTRDFISDIAATSVTDALAYALNAERDTTDGTGNGTGSGDLPLSIRGFTGASLGRNYFQWGLESDTYNTERLDFSRGPNSILFGTGGPGGIINTTTKRALFGRSETQLAYRIGSWDDHRFTFDVSRQLHPKLAVRVNAVQHSAKSWRDFVSSDRSGAALAVTYRPFKHTEIRFDGEHGEFDRVLSNPYLPGDSVTPWLAAGRPVSSVFGTAVAGTTRTTSRVFVHDPVAGTAQSWFGSVTSNSGGASISAGIPALVHQFLRCPAQGQPQRRRQPLRQPLSRHRALRRAAHRQPLARGRHQPPGPGPQLAHQFQLGRCRRPRRCQRSPPRRPRQSQRRQALHRLERSAADL